MSLRDHLPGAGKRKDEPHPSQHYRTSHCELRGCYCRGRGKSDIAIQDANKNVLGYVCQRGYYDHIRARQLDSWHTFKQTGDPINQTVQASIEAKGIHRFADIVSELDRYADNFDHKDESDAHGFD